MRRMCYLCRHVGGNASPSHSIAPGQNTMKRGLCQRVLMKDFLQVLRRFVPPYKKYLVLSVVFNILSAVLNIFSFATLIPMLNILFQTGETEQATQWMAWDWAHVDEVVMNNMNYGTRQLIDSLGATTTLLVIGLVLAFLTFLKTGAYFLSSATIIPIRTGVVRDIRNALYRKITSLSMGFFSEERKGDIIARMSGDVGEVEGSIMASLDMLFKNPILIIAYFATLLVISWQLTLFTLAVVPLMGWLMGVVGRKLKQRSLKAQALWSDTMSMVEETLGGLRIVKAFCAEEKMNQRFDNVNSAYRNNVMRVNIRQQMAHPMSEFLGTVLIVIVLWFGGVLVLNNQTLSGPTFIYYLVILYSIINPLKEFSKASYNIPKGLASMERIDKILQAEVAIQDPAQPKELPNGFQHTIELRDVSFGYIREERDLKGEREERREESGEVRWVLRHINLTIHKGQTVALVGQSGGGKTTLVDLIPRYYDVQEGQILIDGIDIRQLRVHDLRSLIGNVNQESILFNDTFRGNITFGVEQATQQQIEEAARVANAHDFIMASPHGYDTNIGDRGNRLSGGQRQRISIARAILKNPPILILDEATSALDTESERLVQEALDKLMKTRTTIAIAHRLSTIRNADIICVLHEGKIVEQGTHQQLMELNGHYRHLHDMQVS